MKLDRFRWWLAGMVAGAVLQAVAQEDRNVVHSVSGSGHGIFDAELRTFAFHAVQYGDGSVSGEVEVINRDQGERLHGTVICLRVEGNEALVVLQCDNQSDYPGSIGFFAVRDNGEGKAAEPDQITYLRRDLPPEWGCDRTLGFSWGLVFEFSIIRLLPIEKGNIQVR